jgi:superfamily I DNA/RNA helicase
MNAPLISTCLDLLARKVPARIRGRDIGKHLTGVVKKVAKEHGFEFKNFTWHLHDHTQKQIEKLAKQDGNEGRIETLRDCEMALVACFTASDARDTFALCEEIEGLFDDNRGAVYLSTVHKAKGLEADRVFILKPERLPLKWAGQQAWEYEQEMNLKYVAVTRARQELIFVS